MTGEPGIGDYIRAVARNRYRIAVFVFFCAAAAFAVQILGGPVYRASATLVVLPPRFQPEMKPQTMSLQTYRTILFTESIMDHVAREMNRGGGKHTAEGIRRSLTVEFVEESRTPAAVSYSPVLKLYATARKPDDARRIADLSTEALIRKAGELQTIQTGESLRYIEELHGNTGRELKAVDDRIVEFDRRNNLQLMKDSLQVKQEKLMEHMKELHDEKTALDQFTGVNVRLAEMIGRMESDHQWLGAIDPQEVLGGAAGEGKPRGDPFAAETLRAKLNLLELDRRVLAYAKASEISMLEKEKAILEETLKEREKELFETIHDLETGKPDIEKMREQLDKEDALIELSRAIGDEALWARLVRNITPGEAKTLKDMKLKTQEPNPVYFELRKELVTREARYGALEERKEYLGREKEELSKRIRAVDDLLQKRTKGLEHLQNLRKIIEAHYNFLAERYNAIKGQFMENRQRIEVAQAKIAYLEGVVADLKDETGMLVADVTMRELERERLEKERKTISDKYEILSTKVEEARMARADEGTDLKLASRAIKPSRPLKAGKLKNSLLAAGIGLMLSVTAVIASEFLRLTLSPENGKSPS
ncbi:MAG: hypothetical protein AB1742_15635 [bacterium]